MGTNFSDIYEIFFAKIEKDENFWSLYNVSEAELINIAYKRSKNYLIESCYIITEYCDSKIDWFDYDEEIEAFNFELTPVEKYLLASIMMERHLERDISKLKVFELNFTPSDLQIFSPSNSRKTFMNMYESVKKENRLLLDSYASKDRNNKRIGIDYSQYSEE